MKENCTCGIILAEVKYGTPTRWLLCHPTNGGNRWDFPKGNAEKTEDHLKAALRELFEETGTLLMTIQGLIDLGQHPYQDKRDMHLFYLEVPAINTKAMKCTSMVENKKGPDFPEMDAFALFEINKVSSKVSKNLDKWITSYVPREFLAGYRE